jgi:hypothetical protein
MKALNFIDLVVQTLILGLVTIASIVTLFTGNLESVAIAAMYGALFLGPWQLVSSLITNLSNGLYLRWRRIHLLSSLGYFGLCTIAFFIFPSLDGEGIVRNVGGVFGFGIPLVLALFYYYITIKSFQLARSSAKAI